MDKLPDKIKRIDVLRVEFGKKKLCNCHEPHYEIDNQNKLVHCEDCGAIVDPFTALVEIARHYDRIASQAEELLEQRKQIQNYKPHLVVMKELESRYRADNYSMMPVCPRCREPFDLTELTSWVSRKFVQSQSKKQ